jgi:hypothetical protein
LKHKVNRDALVYSLLWALLAAIGFKVAGLKAGLLLSIGLFPLIMLSSVVILSRKGDFRLERIVRWGILAAAAVALASYADLLG